MSEVVNVKAEFYRFAEEFCEEMERDYWEKVDERIKAHSSGISSRVEETEKAASVSFIRMQAVAQFVSEFEKRIAK
jgi:hypothetical protein